MERVYSYNPGARTGLHARNDDDDDNRYNHMPYGRNFRGAGGRSDQSSHCAYTRKNVIKL